MSLALKHRTISSAISTQLRDDVLSGVQPSGAQLRQDALAAQFGVSRIPVREALLQLEAEGLVRIIPHKGAVVTGLSQAEVDDIFALRGLLETRLLRHSAPHLTDEDFNDLDRIQDQFGAAIRSGDAAQWGLLNAELHMAFYRRAELPRTASIVANLLTASERYTRLQLAGEAQWRRAEIEHGELIALCRMHDHEAACSLLERHIAQVHSDLSAMMGPRSAAT
ncbi:MAG: GntR family transcriptional regulator [Bosea sp. (in: a-proteobacteria)]|jgi:DNA-binding GntR family transcriptional regulator